MVRNVCLASVILTDQFASATRNRGAYQLYSVFSLPGIWKLRPSRSRGERSASIQAARIKQLKFAQPGPDQLQNYQEKPGQNRSSADAAAFFRRSLCAAFVSIDSCIKPATLASIKRPALRSPASLSRAPTSSKLFTANAPPFTAPNISASTLTANLTA